MSNDYWVKHCEDCTGAPDCPGVERGIGDTEIRKLFEERDRLRSDNAKCGRIVSDVSRRLGVAEAHRDGYRDALAELWQALGEAGGPRVRTVRATNAVINAAALIRETPDGAC